MHKVVPADSTHGAGSEGKVVLAEDDESLRFSFKRFLKRAGYNVVEAEDGTQALKLCEEEKPDVVVTDNNMSGMDGLELIKRLKGTPKPPYMILITARGSAEDYGGCGADKVLIKPVDKNTLLTAVAEGMGKSRQTS